MAPPPPKGKAGFRLPADVSFEKQRLCDAWAYAFRHRVLGELGRILLQELGDGRCHISCEVVGDPADPMTAQRMAIFKPLALALTCQMEAAMGATPSSRCLLRFRRNGPCTLRCRSASSRAFGCFTTSRRNASRGSGEWNV
jgi:hypothetical protein